MLGLGSIILLETNICGGTYYWLQLCVSNKFFSEYQYVAYWILISMCDLKFPLPKYPIYLKQDGASSW